MNKERELINVLTTIALEHNKSNKLKEEEIAIQEEQLEVLKSIFKSAK